MDSIRDVLTTIKNLLVWLPDPVVSFIILAPAAAIAALNITADLYLRQFRLDVDDNLMARKHITQVRVLLRASDVLVVIVTFGAALMTSEPVRQYGVSLFASAGVAGGAAQS